MPYYPYIRQKNNGEYVYKIGMARHTEIMLFFDLFVHFIAQYN